MPLHSGRKKSITIYVRCVLNQKGWTPIKKYSHPKAAVFWIMS